MAESSMIRLTINDKPLEGRTGQTILDVCRAAGIYVPTLCYHPQLSVAGACRMCMVEVEGNPKLQPSCSTPAVDGMVIQTETDQLHDHRRLNLEFLFAERSHICPFCESSGACDLQRLAYEHQMESVRVEYLTPRLSTDLSSPYFGLDHNRCILCTRCVRVCDEIEGVHTLDLIGRGGNTMIGVDLHGEFGTSSCTMCGACVQVCPTGALYDKMPAYRGRPQDLEEKRTTCPGCGVGCGLVAQTRYGRVVRVVGDTNCETNEGHTCRIGRYGSQSYGDKRIERPKIGNKENGAGWDEVLACCKQQISENGGEKAVVALNSQATLESCVEVRALLGALGNNAVATLLDVGVPPDPKPAPGLDALGSADVVWVVDCDPVRLAPVLASVIRRRVRKRDVKLIVCSRLHTELDRHADAVLNMKSSDAASLIAQGLEKNSIVVLPAGTEPRVAEAVNACLNGDLQHVVVTCDRTDRRGRIRRFPVERLEFLDEDRVRVVNLTAGTNTLGIAALLGENLTDRRSLYDAEIGTLIAVPGDRGDEHATGELIKLAEKAACTILLASYANESHPKAAATLPVAAWWEEGPGHIVNLGGDICEVKPVVPLRGSAFPLADALKKLTAELDPSSTAETLESRDLATIRKQLDQAWNGGREVVR